MKRIMIAGTHSGCGKTTVTCAVLQALCDRNIRVSSFKCGPDYIDPMFHRRITGVPSYNLDGKFCTGTQLRSLLAENARDIAVIEGVMGFYDGADQKSSSCGVSMSTDTPVVIVIDCKGASQSLGAVMKGFLTYRKNHIAGFIFNRLPNALIEQTMDICNELGAEFLGSLPSCPDAVIESRHLGLVTADEIGSIKEKMERLSALAEENIRLDRLIGIAENAADIKSELPCPVPLSDVPVRIAVARDSAFCFYYEETFELLKRLGCEMIPFSPIADKKLPDGICGMYIGGGYPELYAKKLSDNKDMTDAVRAAIEDGVPTIAECGGFMYLCSELSDSSGRCFRMAGVFGGKCFPTGRLQRFGYAQLTAQSDNMLCKKDDKLMAHEFHYWDCTDNGSSFLAQRSRNRTDRCVFADGHIYAGFPHLYLYSRQDAAENFVRKCMEYREK